MQVVVLFDSDGSTEEPHIILELSMSCVRHAGRVRHRFSGSARVSERALAGMRAGSTPFCELERATVRDSVRLCQ